MTMLKKRSLNRKKLLEDFKITSETLLLKLKPRVKLVLFHLISNFRVRRNRLRLKVI